MSGRLIASGVLVGALLLGCSTLPTAGSQSDKVTVFFSSSKQGELEACGCSLAPLGGVGREWNALTEEKSQNAGQAVLVTGGTTFVPGSERFNSSQLPLYREQAKIMAEALSEMRYRAISPSVDDLSLGVETVKELADLYELPFVSANIVSWNSNAPLFPQKIRTQIGGREVVITGLSAFGTNGHVPTGVGLLRPDLALQAALEDVGPNALIIVLSNLDGIDISATVQTLGRPTLWLGGNEKNISLDAKALNRRHIHLNPYKAGMYLSRVDLTFNGEPTGFFDAEGSAGLKQDIELWKSSLVEIEATLQTKKLNKKSREALNAQKRILESSLTEVSVLPVQQAPGLVTYVARSLPLSARYQTPENKIHSIAARGRETGRSLAEKPTTVY